MEQIAINILPKGAKPVCHSSQFDEGRQIMFNLFNDDTPYTLSGTETISVLVRKPDGSEVIDSVTNTSDSYVIWDVSADACELSGVCECEFSITKNGIVLGSKNFTMKVEEDAYGGRNIEVRTASGRIATFNTNIVEAFKSLKSDINPVQDLHGYSKPWSGGGGKNKFNDTTGTHTINANTDTTITIGDVYLEANTTYTISCKQTPAPLTSFVRNTLSVVGGGTTTYNPAGNDYTIKPMVFTPSVSGTYSIRVWGHTLSANTTYSQFQVEVGSTATAYEPYSNICPISGFSALNVTRTGKNLCFDAYGNKANANTYLYPSGDNLPITVNNSLRTAYAYVGKNQDVVVSFASAPQRSIVYGLEAYPALGVICHSLSVTALSSTSFKLNSGNYDYIAFYYCNDLANIPSDCQIELGNQASTYEPYNGQTATVNFGQTVYGGVLDVTNGKVNVTRNIVDLSTLNWVYASGAKRWEAQKTDMKNYPSRNADIIFEKYETDTTATAGSEGKGFISGLVIYVTSNDSTTRPSGNACYPLATPIEITTTPENLTALSGQNNVYSDTNGNTEVEYYIEV